jgi:flagellar motor component MotA
MMGGGPGATLETSLSKEAIMARFIVGVVILLALIAGAVLLEGGRLLLYVGVSAFIVVFFPPVFASLAVWKGSSIAQAFRDSLGGRGGAGNAARSARIWAFYERVFILSGILGWLLGVILILSVLGSAWVTAIPLSRALSTSLLPLVYGILFGILARILRTRAEGRAA